MNLFCMSKNVTISTNPDHFYFAHVIPKNVLSVIQCINVKKSTGYDMMPPNLLN